MKRLLKTVKSLLLGSLLLASAVVEAQFTGSYPISQAGNYLSTYQGRTPSSPNKQHAIDAYNSWKQNFVTSSGACGEQRVIFDYYQGGLGKTDRSQTVSEGIAYGMLLSAYAGDRPLFDDLWAYYKIHRNQNGVMHWKIENCGVIGANGASDAELDVAMALIVASHQWQNDGYLNDARTLIRIIREKEFEGTVLKPGDMFGGSNLTNPSYFSPAYYRVFAQLEPQHATFWSNAATRGYEIIEAAEKFNNGLVPDWCRADGNFSNEAGNYYMSGQRFFFDAVRTPFRSSIDYLWHGTPRAQQYCNRLIQWSFNAHGGGTEQLQSNYSIDGTPHGGGHSNTFVGCFAIAAMSTGGGTLTNTQYDSYLNRAYADNQNTQPGYGQYFNASIKAIALFVMNGYFYLPPPDQCDAPNLGTDKSLCAGSVTLNAGVGATGTHTYTWRRNGQTIAGTARTLSVNTPGEYEVIVRQNSNGCTRRAKVNVGAAQLNADFIVTAVAGNLVATNTSTGGISSYSWRVTGNGVDEIIGTDRDALKTGLTAGLYEVTLTINNAGFGCSGTSSATRNIVIGNGVGVALDDFNGLYEQGINLYTYGATANIFNPFPVTYCSRADELAGNDQECQNHRCSYVDLKCNGTTAPNNWASMEFELFGEGYPLNLSNGAYLSVKMKASAPVTVAWRIGQSGTSTNGANTGTILATAQTAALTTEEQIFTFDFTNVLTGDVDGAAATVAAWNAVNKITLRPYGTTPAFNGTISIDWVILGDKSLPAPSFDIRKDEFGYTDFSNYLPDYYPNDPAYADCTPSSEDGCYGSVPDWERRVVACDETATVVARACLASEIRWYNLNNTLVATGDEAELAPGKYYVDLIGAGGVTRDSVEVVGNNLTADFLIDNVNYDAYFINQSTGFTSFTWSYGDPNLADPASPTWDLGYHNYEEGVGELEERTFTVGITVENETCGTELTVTKQLTIRCDMLPTDIVLVESTTEGCEGDIVTFEIEASEYASNYGWYPPIGTTISGDSLEATLTFGPNPGPLKIEAYNACGKSELIVDLNIVPTPTGDFTMTPSAETGLTVDLEATTRIADEYAWIFGDGTNETGESPDVSKSYADEDIYDICLTVTNACGTSTQVCKPYSAVINSLMALDNAGLLEFFPTVTSDFINIKIKGAAQYSIIDVSGQVIKGNTVLSNIVNVADLESGVYTLRIQQGDEVVSKRFVKN